MSHTNSNITRRTDSKYDNHYDEYNNDITYTLDNSDSNYLTNERSEPTTSESVVRQKHKSKKKNKKKREQNPNDSCNRNPDDKCDEFDCKINPHASIHLKKIIELLLCIIENIKLIISLACLVQCDNVITKVRVQLCDMYECLLEIMACKTNYYLVKCLRPQFKKYYKIICKIHKCKAKDEVIYEVYDKINCKQIDILKALKCYQDNLNESSFKSIKI
jgi:hypothetical protein